MKIYKGLDLVKAVANYEIEKGTKLKCIHYPTYGQGIEVHTDRQRLIWSDTKEPIDYGHFLDGQFEFEIIEEEKDIEEITIRDKTIGFPNGEWTARNMDKAFAYKINELVREINKLKNK